MNLNNRIKRLSRITRETAHNILFSKKYEGNEFYNLDLVESGFENRNVESTDNKYIERIIRSYNLAKDVQLRSGQCYQVSNEWLPIYEAYMGDIINALSSSAVSEVAKIYNNFFRESCSVGLHGLPVDMAKNYFNGKISRKYKKLFLDDFIHRYLLWKSALGKEFTITSLVSPNIGNPYGYNLNNLFIKAGSDYLHYYATIISRLTNKSDKARILELGGGFGGMAYYLMRDNPSITYIDIDLPENLALTAFYLLNSFPEKKIVLYGEDDISENSIDKYDAILLPNFEISTFSDNSIDLSFNSYSLAEMSNEAIENYLLNIGRITKTFIYHVNHIRNSVVSGDDFPLNLDKYELLYRAPALWNMARKYDMDEYEFLYKSRDLKFSI